MPSIRSALPPFFFTGSSQSICLSLRKLISSCPSPPIVLLNPPSAAVSLESSGSPLRKIEKSLRKKASKASGGTILWMILASSPEMSWPGSGMSNMHCSIELWLCQKLAIILQSVHQQHVATRGALITDSALQKIPSGSRVSCGAKAAANSPARSSRRLTSGCVEANSS